MPENLRNLKPGETLQFPATLKGVRCPTCKQYVTGMFLRESTIFKSVVNKYLLPCQCQITTEQEDAIVNDILKRGL